MKNMKFSQLDARKMFECLNHLLEMVERNDDGSLRVEALSVTTTHLGTDDVKMIEDAIGHAELTSHLLCGSECPQCNEHYYGFPALSRRDNETEICPTCGTLEALDDIVGAGVTIPKG